MQDNLVFSVTQVNNEIKAMLEGNPVFRNIFVQGEISNYKLHTSGHHYMTLKDQDSVLSAVLFRSDASKLKFRLENGMKIIARGRISSFPKSGQYQMYISDVIADGSGALYIAFERLKAMLYQEGLFDAVHKKALPRFPQNIAVITSPTGAAIRDMLRILKRRYPLAAVQIYPVLVQGENAPAEIVQAISLVNERKTADLIITGRGGGSIEDLWAFNDETVARAIYASAIPVISAVGHEPDVTISDFVADVRAATPSNAAELAVPEQMELRSFLKRVEESMLASISLSIRQNRRIVDGLTERLQLRSTLHYIQDKRVLLEHTTHKMGSIMQNNLLEKRQAFVKNTAYLDAFSPLKVLSRGYAITTSESGKIITKSNVLCEGESIHIRFYEGSADCRVVNVNE